MLNKPVWYHNASRVSTEVSTFHWHFKGNCNGTRTAAMKALLAWMSDRITGASSDPDVLLVGDLNACEHEGVSPVISFQPKAYAGIYFTGSWYCEPFGAILVSMACVDELR